MYLPAPDAVPVPDLNGGYSAVTRLGVRTTLQEPTGMEGYRPRSFPH